MPDAGKQNKKHLKTQKFPGSRTVIQTVPVPEIFSFMKFFLLYGYILSAFWQHFPVGKRQAKSCRCKYKSDQKCISVISCLLKYAAYDHRACQPRHGCLTVELKKNLCRPHQTCIFLSNFLFYYIVFYSNI